jgi:hypothetical protein
MTADAWRRARTLPMMTNNTVVRVSRSHMPPCASQNTLLVCGKGVLGAARDMNCAATVAVASESFKSAVS